jgi:hypothetical protein
MTPAPTQTGSKGQGIREGDDMGKGEEHESISRPGMFFILILFYSTNFYLQNRLNPSHLTMTTGARDASDTSRAQVSHFFHLFNFTNIF